MIRKVKCNRKGIFKSVIYSLEELNNILIILKTYKPFLGSDEFEITDKFILSANVKMKVSSTGNVEITFTAEEYNILIDALAFYKRALDAEYTFITPVVSSVKDMLMIFTYKQYRTLKEALVLYAEILSRREPVDAVEKIRIMVEQDKINKAIGNIDGFFNCSSDKKICHANLLTGIIALNFMIEFNDTDEEVREFCTYLEKLIGYSYNTACEKCKIKSKEKDNMGLGLSGMEQLARR